MNNKLTCKICNRRYKNPKMCPHCSQVFCQGCIIEYLADKHFCPTCDNYIIDLIDCSRLIDEVQQIIDQRNGNKNNRQGLSNMSSVENNKNIGNRLEQQKCRLHSLQLKYYCLNCKAWLCSDCGVIDQTHRQHKICTKKDILIESKENISKILLKVNRKIEKVRHKKEKYNLDLQIYKTQLKWCKNQIVEYCQYLLNKTQQQGKKGIDFLQNKLKQCSQKFQNLRQKQFQLQKFLNLSSQQQQLDEKKIRNLSAPHIMQKIQSAVDFNMINNSNSVFSMKGIDLKQHHKTIIEQMSISIPLERLQEKKRNEIEDFDRQQEKKDESIQDISEIFKEKAPKLQTIMQVIPEFSKFTYQYNYNPSHHIGIYHYSDYFDLWGQQWRLKIYPNGNNHSQGYMSVFLELKNGYHNSRLRKYVYRIELLSLNRVGSTIVKQYCSQFENGQCWGYSDFLNLHHIDQYLIDGRLLFSVSIRNHSHAGFSEDLKNYISKKQKQTKILQKLLCESNYEHQLGQSDDNRLSINENSQQIKIDLQNSSLTHKIDQYRKFTRCLNNNDGDSEVISKQEISIDEDLPNRYFEISHQQIQLQEEDDDSIFLEN